MATISSLAAKAKKKAEEEARKKAEEAKRKAQEAQRAAEAAQRAKEAVKTSTQNAASRAAQKAAQAVTGKSGGTAAAAEAASAQKKRSYEKKKVVNTGTTGTQGKAKASVTKQVTEAVKKAATETAKATDGNDRSSRVRYVSQRRSASAKELTQEAKRRITTEGLAQKRAGMEKTYQGLENKFAADWDARQGKRSSTLQYRRKDREADTERLSNPDLNREREVARTYFRSGIVDPLSLAKADGYTGRDPAKTAPKLTAAQKAQAAAKKKQEEYNYARYSQVPLSNADRKLPEGDRLAIQRERRAWERARDAGDLGEMSRAHIAAEAIRNRHGYTGGQTGDEYYSPSLTLGERLRLNKKGEAALKRARLTTELTSPQAARERAAEKELEVLEKPGYRSFGSRAADRYRQADEAMETEREKGLSFDAHGRPIAMNPTSGQFYAGIEHAPYSWGADALSNYETVRNVLKENQRNRMRDEWARMADKLPEYEGQLKAYDELVADGYTPETNRDVLLKQIRAARYAKEQLEQISLDPRSDAFDPNLAAARGLPTEPEQTLGDRWMEKSRELQATALEGLGPASSVLAEAAMSAWRNAPGIAASIATGSVIPGMLIGGLQAAGEEGYDLRQRGEQNARTAWRSGLKGLSEAGWESLGMGNLVGLATGRISAPLLQAAARQAGAGALEEMGTYATDYGIDRYIARDPEVRFSPAEMGRSGLIGAISEGAFGAVGSVAGAPARGGSNVPEQYRDSTPTLAAGRQTALPQGVRDDSVVPLGTTSPLADAAAGLSSRTRLEQALAERRAAQEGRIATPAAQARNDTTGSNVVPFRAQTETGRPMYRRGSQTAETGQASTMGSQDRESAAANRAFLAENSRRIGAAGRQAIVANYRDGEDAAAYKKAFESVYDQALTGTAEEKIRRSSRLDELQFKSAVLAGTTDRMLSLNREKAEAKNAKVSREGGLRDYDAVRKIVGKKTAKEINAVAKAFGQRVSYVSAQEMKNPAAQGEVSGNEVRINRDYQGGDAVSFIVGHEFTHRMQEIAPEEYRAFRDLLMQDEGNLARVDGVIEAYQRAGESLSREAAMDEITADAAGAMFQDSSVMEDFIARNRGNQNVLVRMWQALRDLATRLTGRQRKQADQAMTLLENAMDETARRVKDLPVEGATDRNVGGTRQSFAGRNARTANVQRLQNAEEMERNGQDNEAIRQETGWHKGRDGKWRFEIDDSQMQYFPDGDAAFQRDHPEYAELQGLYRKWFDSGLTDAEQDRLFALDDTWRNEYVRLSERVERGEATLEDIIQHDALFEAYPELRDIRIEMRDMDARAGGVYYPREDKIVLNSNEIREGQKSSLLHEIQHAIQTLEGFSPGTSTKAYEGERKELEDAVRDVEHNRDLWLKDAGVPDFVRESMEQVRQGKRTIPEHFAALERFKQESKYAEEIAASEEAVRRARERLSEYGTPYDRYKRTAGEIEARDTQARRKLTAEERKNTAPDLGGEDTLFAKGDGPSSLIDQDFAEEVKTWDKEGRPDGETFVLGSTGSVLQGLGAIESDIYIQGDKIKDILTEHPEMTVREVQQIPGILEDPVLILKSQNKGRGGRQNTRMVLYGSVRAQNGEPVLTVLDLRPVENGLVIEDMQKVSSAYTKTTNPTDFVRNSDVIHVDEKRAVPLLRSIGFQMPIELQRKGSIGSISYNQRSVNISGLPFSEVIQEKPAENNPDIRYSIKTTGVTGQEAAELARENRELRQQVEHWRAQVKRTDRRDVDPASLRRLAKQLRQDYSSTMNPDEIAERLGEIYNGISHDMAYDQAQALARSLAGDMVSQAEETEDYLYHEYEPMRKYFRETPLVLTPTDAGQITDYNEFRKAMFGKMRLKTGQMGNVDQVYQELSQRWPEWFDEARESNSLDQVERIAQVLDEVYSREAVNPFAEDMAGPVNYLTGEIMGSFWDAPAVKKTFADRQQDRVAREIRKRNEMRDRYQEALRTVRENRDRKIRQEQEKRWAAVDALRQDRDRKVGAEQTKRREQKQQMQTRQKERELRARITRHSRDLSGKLLRPSDARHVPQELRAAAASVLESINLESVYTYDPVTGRRSKDPNGSPAKRTQAFQELRTAYQKIAQEEALNDYVIDPALMNNITEIEGFRDRPIGALNLDELRTVWNTIRAVEHSISTANRMLAQGQFRTTMEAAQGLREDNAGKRKRGELRGFAGRMEKLLNVDMMKPQQFFHRLGKSGDKLFRMLRNADDQQTLILKDVKEKTAPALKGVNTRRLSREKKHFAFGEEEVTFTKAQIMSLYELMKRDKAVQHILVGGIRPGEYGSGIRESNRATPLRLERSQLESITASLTAEEKAAADRLQKILQDDMARYGNEASMLVYGYEKFGDENYFPIQTDKNQTYDDIVSQAQAGTLPGRGFAQQTKPNASNAVIVNDIFDVFSDHVSEMSTYAAFLPAMEDLKRVFNFRFKNEDGSLGNGVKAILETVYGKNGVNYWRKLTEDLNNGVKTINDSPFGGLAGNYKASAIGANLRVMIQQPTSIIRALDEISPADFIAAAGSVTPAAWERAKEYAPIALWKSWGYFDAYTGRPVRDLLIGDGDGLSKVSSALMSGVGAMDSWAWTHLWRAVEIETSRTRKDLQPRSRDYYQAVAERFGEVVDRTQVVDGVLQRSQIMRSQSDVTKMATSFMSEPTTIYNMLTGAAYDMRNANTAAARRKAGGHFSRTAVALTTSIVVNTAAQSVIDAMRDDDNEERYWEKFLQAFLGYGEDAKSEEEERENYLFSNLAEGFNPATYIPWVKDLWSIYQGYSVERMDMESVGRIVNESRNVIKAMEDGGKLTTGNAISRLIGETARLVGLPAANLKRDALAGFQTVLRGTGQYKLLYETAKLLYRLENSNNGNTFLDIAYAAKRSGDLETYRAIEADLKSVTGKDQKWIDKGINTRLAADGDLEGIQATQFDAFSRAVSQIKGNENSSKQEQIIDYIDRLDLTKKQKSALFHTQYESDKNNPWA